NISDLKYLVSQDYGDYCKTEGHSSSGCAQFTIRDEITEYIPEIHDPDNAALPHDPYLNFIVNTLNPLYGSSNRDNYFMPKSADANKEVHIDYNNSAGR